MRPRFDVVDSAAGENGFAGVVSVDRGGEVEFAKAYGLAHRAHEVANTLDTQFAVASGSKGLTALTVISLIEGDGLSLSTTARSPGQVLARRALLLLQQRIRRARIDRRAGGRCAVP
jgi:CubicO group peptidase (beta-lactamase class C family)